MASRSFRIICLLISVSVIAAAEVIDTTGERYGTGENGMLNFYQRVISPLKGGNTCPMHPSCSQYAKLAVQKHGFFKGVVATCDRYVRCGRDTENYRRVVTDSTIYLYDPVAFADSTGSQDTRYDALPVAATDPGTTECTQFPVHLEEQGLYHLAQVEYERLLYTAQRPLCSKEAAQGILSISYRIDGIDGFRRHFYRLLDTLSDDSIATQRCGLLFARKYMQYDRYKDALRTVAAYRLTDNRTLLDQGYALAAVSRLYLRQFNKARNCADSISSDGNLASFTTKLSGYDKKITGFDRSPPTAGVMSALLPGSGYLYAGRPQTALASLLVNGLFIWTTAEFFTNRHYAAGTTALVLGMGFYIGNIRGSVQAAEKYNERGLDRRIRSLVEGIPIEW